MVLDMATLAPHDQKMVDTIADKVFANGRISSEEAIALFCRVKGIGPRIGSTGWSLWDAAR